MKPFHNKIYKNNEICVMSAWATTDWSFCFLLFLWFFALIEKLPGAENIVSFIQKKMPNIPCFQRNKCEDLSLWSGLICRKKLSNTINNDFTHLSVKKLATFQQPLLTHRLLLIPMASLLSISLFSFQYHYSHYSESSHLMLCFATQLFCIGLYQEKKMASVRTLQTEEWSFWAECCRRRSVSPTWTLVRCRYMTQATWKHTHSTSSSSTSIPLREQSRGESRMRRASPSFPPTAVKTPSL